MQKQKDNAANCAFASLQDRNIASTMERVFLHKMLALTVCLVLSLFGICAGQKQTNVLCNQKGDLDLLNPRDTNGYVDGVVLLCEGGEWRTVHDPRWTVEDRTVACRQLGHGRSEEYLIPAELFVEIYQPSRRVVQCNGSEDRLFDCVDVVTNYTTIDPTTLTTVFVNCTNRTLHSSPVPKLSQNFSRTERVASSSSTRHIPPSSKTERVASSSSTRHIPPSSKTERVPSSSYTRHIPPSSKTERVTSSSSTRHTPPPDPASSPPREAAFLTPLNSGILGGLATLIGVTVVILGIFIVATRTKACRTSKRKRNSDEYSANQPRSSADTADDILTEESVAYGVRDMGELRIPVVQCAAYGVVPSGETGLTMQDADYEIVA